MNYTYLDLFKTLQMCTIVLLSTVMWMIAILVYDAHLRTILIFGKDVFITFTISVATELPANCLLMFYLDAIGRKCMCFTALFVSTFGSFIAAFLTGWHVVILAILCRFCTSITFMVALQWSAEMLPTVLRGQGVSFIHLMGFVSGLMSPFIVYTEKYSESLPMIILGCLSGFATVLCLWLPETTNRELVELPEDIDAIMKDQHWYPWLHK